METSEISVGGRTSYRINMPFERKWICCFTSRQQFLVMYGEYGDAPTSEVLKKTIDTVLLSYINMLKTLRTAKAGVTA